MKHVINFVKKEAVLSASALLAVISAFFVPPSAEYISYIDFRVLSLLFCLMLVVAGLRGIGVFHYLGSTLLGKAKSTRLLSLLLVGLCFFSSMLITNDVSLITFVPFAVMILSMADLKEMMIPVIVLQTIAANLGSMLTPIGNPQNLYLYSIADFTAGEFVRAVLPYAGLAFVMLMTAVLIERDEPLLDVDVREENEAQKRQIFREMLPFLILLVLCLLVVFRVLPYQPVLICVMCVVLVVNRKLYLSVDYFLLLTFLCFFIFIGNMKRIPEISSFLISVVEGRELLMGIFTSQIISNVPAAILLSGFSSDLSALLTGVNVGGLGTLIASLASLISFKFFAKEYPDKKGAYMLRFTIWNGIFLAVLIAEALLLGKISG